MPPLTKRTEHLNTRLQGFTRLVFDLMQREKQHTHMPIEEARRMINDSVSVASQVFTQNQQLTAHLQSLSDLWREGDPAPDIVTKAVKTILDAEGFLEA